MNWQFRNKKKAEVSFLILHEVELKPKSIQCDKEHFQMLNSIFHNEDTVFMEIMYRNMQQAPL